MDVDLDVAVDVALFGFAPFGPFEVNPTAELVRGLAAAHPDWSASMLEVEPDDTAGELFDVLDSGARLVVGFGVRVGTPELELNTAAINWLAMRSEADALHFGPIDPGLPVELSVEPGWQQTVFRTLDSAGATLSLSDDAGMHACNLALFHGLAHAPADTRVVFLHVGPNILERPDLVARLATGLGNLVRELAPRPSRGGAAQPR